ncbi:MAG: hypothetical protein PHY59_02110 [Methanobacterium sp.]|nr:hypothetical protein [Methanobacterium sp.]
MYTKEQEFKPNIGNLEAEKDINGLIKTLKNVFIAQTKKNHIRKEFKTQDIYYLIFSR